MCGGFVLARVPGGNRVQCNRTLGRPRALGHQIGLAGRLFGYEPSVTRSGRESCARSTTGPAKCRPFQAQRVDGAVAGPPIPTGSRCQGRRHYNGTDSAPNMPRCVITAGDFDWGEDEAPRTPLDETVIYETHVKGLTQAAPGSPLATSRDLRRVSAPGDNWLLGRPRDYCRRAVARPPVRAGFSPAKSGDCVITGDITASVSSLPTATTAPQVRVAGKSTSSNQWSRPYIASV